MRRLIYTTNAIEGVNRQLRKETKTKAVFPADDSLLKMPHLAMIDITKKWTVRRQNRSLIYAQMKRRQPGDPATALNKFCSIRTLRQHRIIGTKGQARSTDTIVHCCLRFDG